MIGVKMFHAGRRPLRAFCSVGAAPEEGAVSLRVPLFKLICVSASLCLLLASEPAAGGVSSAPCVRAAGGGGDKCVQSLKSLADGHAGHARKVIADAQPFEVSLQNLAPDFLKTGKVGLSAEVSSSFSSPRDDVWYFKVRGPAESSGGAVRPPEVVKEGFVIKACEQGFVTPEMKCLQPTGEPEPRSRHLPIQKWKVDLAQLRRILTSNKVHPSAPSAIIVTTAGRLKAESDAPDGGSPVAQRVSHLPDNYAVISIVGRDGDTVEYFIVGAEKGEVIAAGAYGVKEENLFRPSGPPGSASPPARP